MTIRVGTPRMNRSYPGLLLALSATLPACATDDVLGPASARPAGVVLTTDGPVSLASFGDTAVLRPRVLDRDGNPLDGVQLQWALRSTGVLRREADGVFRAIGNGRVTVVAAIDPGETGVRPDGYWAGPIADSVTIEVRQRPARLTIGPVDTVFGTLGARRQLRAQVTDARGNPMQDAPPLVWESADSSVVTVDSAGLVRSLDEGIARITVRAAELTGATTFTVSPRVPHTSCMVFTQRRRARQSCVTLQFTLREREGDQ